MRAPVPCMWFCTYAICHCVALLSAEGTTVNQNSRSSPVLAEQIHSWPGAVTWGWGGSPGYIRAAAQRCDLGPYRCAQSNSASAALKAFSIWCLATILCSLCDLRFRVWVAATPCHFELLQVSLSKRQPDLFIAVSGQSVLCLTGISRS